MALLANIGQGIAVLINVSRSRNVCVCARVHVCVHVCQGHEEKEKDLQLWCFGRWPVAVLLKALESF